MSDCTLRESRHEKKELQYKIAGLLNQFSKETGLYISGVDIETQNVIDYAPKVISVNIEVKL